MKNSLPQLRGVLFLIGVSLLAPAAGLTGFALAQCSAA